MGGTRLALVGALITFGAASLEAAPVDEIGEWREGAAIRVINNYVSPVKVYVEDANGKLHRLGTVQRRHAEVLQIAPEITARGPYRIKVFPNEPLWGPVTDDFGVRTRDIRLADDQVLNFWVEPDLTQSRLEVTNG